MIASRWLRILGWCGALASSAASAVGLGEINLHSRIGEPLRADLSILASGELLDAACFSLAPIPGADLPVVTAARTRLVRGGQGYRLIITGNAPIDEAVLMISVRAGCGMDLQREYVLLPMPPLASAVGDGEAPPLAVASPAPPRKARRARDSGPRNEADETSAATVKPSPSGSAQASAAQPRPLRPRDTLAGLNSSRDRLRLGAALDELPPPAAGDPLAPVNAQEERLLKMETTLHLINEQVDKLDKALALNAEARSVRQQLQDLQMQQPAPGFLPVVAAAPQSAVRRDRTSPDGWIELVLGILLGGSASATIAHLVSRRQGNSRPFDAPPHIAKPRPTAAA